MTRESGEWKPTVAQLKQLIADHTAMKSHPDNEDFLETHVFRWALKNLGNDKQVAMQTIEVDIEAGARAICNMEHGEGWQVGCKDSDEAWAMWHDDFQRLASACAAAWGLKVKL